MILQGTIPLATYLHSELPSIHREMTYFKSQQSKLFEFIVKMYRNEIRQGRQSITKYLAVLPLILHEGAVQCSPIPSWTVRFAGDTFLVFPNDSGHCWSRRFSTAWGIFMV